MAALTARDLGCRAVRVPRVDISLGCAHRRLGRATEHDLSYEERLGLGTRCVPSHGEERGRLCSQCRVAGGGRYVGRGRIARELKKI